MMGSYVDGHLLLFFFFFVIVSDALWFICRFRFIYTTFKFNFRQDEVLPFRLFRFVFFFFYFSFCFVLLWIKMALFSFVILLNGSNFEWNGILFRLYRCCDKLFFFLLLFLVSWNFCEFFWWSVRMIHFYTMTRHSTSRWIWCLCKLHVFVLVLVDGSHKRNLTIFRLKLCNI